MTPEWLDGFIRGGLATASVMLIVDHLVIPWFARLKFVRLADRRAARARRSDGTG